MRIYFTASIVGKKLFLDQYLLILKELKRQGHTVVSDHILQTTEEQLRIEKSDERKAFHKKLESWIVESDAVIVEASFPSISVGYEISLALNRGKAVLVLHTNADPPSLLTDIDSEHLIIEHYNSVNLPTILDNFLSYAVGAHDTRFTFFLNRDQAHYLTNQSLKSNLPKSVYLRNLIDQDRKKTTS